MKKYKLILLFCPLLIATACNGQNNETYWKTENVTKTDGKPFHGITSSYMDMIAEMRIHLTKNNDSLLISYPFERKIKISELKSLTNARIKDSGKLLDSVYEVKIEANFLKIKFHYIGTADEVNTFSLNLIKVDREKYAEEVAKLKKERDRLIDKIKPLDLSSLDLSMAKPAYFNDENLGNAINPIQLAEELCDMNSKRDPITQFTSDFTFEMEIGTQPAETYTVSAIENTEKINRVVASVGKVSFNSLELISQLKKVNPEFILLTKDANHEQMQELYNSINLNLPNARIETKGLPRYDKDKERIDLDDFISISWLGEQKTIKLLIDVSRDYDKKNTGDDAVLAFDEQNPKAIREVFRHYFDLFDQAKVRLYIVSKPFDNALKADEYLTGVPTTLSDYQRW